MQLANGVSYPREQLRTWITSQKLVFGTTQIWRTVHAPVGLGARNATGWMQFLPVSALKGVDTIYLSNGDGVAEPIDELLESDKPDILVGRDIGDELLERLHADAFAVQLEEVGVETEYVRRSICFIRSVEVISEESYQVFNGRVQCSRGSNHRRPSSKFTTSIFYYTAFENTKCDNNIVR